MELTAVAVAGFIPVREYRLRHCLAGDLLDGADSLHKVQWLNRREAGYVICLGACNISYIGRMSDFYPFKLRIVEATLPQTTSS
jgi:hypothetical protein